MTEYGNLTGAPIKFPWTEQQRYQNYKESYFYAIKWNSTTINKTIFISNQKLNLENCTTSTIFLNIHLLLLLYHTTSSYYLLQFKSPSSMHPRDSFATQSDFAKKSLPALYHYGGIFQICPICTNRKAAIITCKWTNICWTPTTLDNNINESYAYMARYNYVVHRKDYTYMDYNLS